MPVHEHILDLHQKRAANSLARLVEAFDAGELRHEADLLERFYVEFTGLYNNLTEPLITPETMKVGDLLRVSAIRRPLQQLDEDLASSFEQLGRLTGAVIATSNVTTVERAGLDNLLASAQDKVSAAWAWASNSNPVLQWQSETFKTTNNVDRPATTAWVDTKLGVATLGIVGESPLSDRVSRVSIQHVGPGSRHVDGLPGNWLELASGGSNAGISEVSEPVAPQFVGEIYDSSNPAAMFDGDPQSWFEWEKYLVPKTQKLTSRGSAWVVADATSGEVKDVFGSSGVTRDFGWQFVVHWPGGDQEDDTKHWVVIPTEFNGDPSNIDPNHALSMTMEVEFDSPQELSWLELLPYFPRGSLYYSVKSIQVSPDGANDWKELVKTPIVLNTNIRQPIDNEASGIPVKDYSGTAVVTCPVTRVKAVRITLEQLVPYETAIAHKYYLKKSLVTDTDAKWWGGSSTKTYWEEARTETPKLISQSKSNSGFLGMWRSGLTKEDKSVSTYFDFFRAYRYCIGIRDLGLLKRIYSTTSKFVSRPLIFDKKVTSASLVVSERIPDEWDSSKSWITYEISHDGVTWQRVLPINTDGSAGAAVNFPATTRLYVRATMSRPEDRPTETPVLEYYAVQAIPEGAI